MDKGKHYYAPDDLPGGIRPVGITLSGQVTSSRPHYRGRWKKIAIKIPLVRRWIRPDGIDILGITPLEFSLVSYRPGDERFGIHPVQFSGMRGHAVDPEPFNGRADE